jgi:hypothetical protein
VQVRSLRRVRLADLLQQALLALTIAVARAPPYRACTLDPLAIARNFNVALRMLTNGVAGVAVGNADGDGPDGWAGDCSALLAAVLRAVEIPASWEESLQRGASHGAAGLDAADVSALLCGSVHIRSELDRRRICDGMLALAMLAAEQREAAANAMRSAEADELRKPSLGLAGLRAAGRRPAPTHSGRGCSPRALGFHCQGCVCLRSPRVIPLRHV